MDKTRRELCAEYTMTFRPCALDSLPGIAIQTPDDSPIHGLRPPPTDSTNGTSGQGEYSCDEHFFQPGHAFHLTDPPERTKCLGLSPGAGFLLARDRTDVWRDPLLLQG